MVNMIESGIEKACLQLGLTSMQRAGKEKSALQRFLQDAVRQIKDLKQAVVSMASSKNLVQEPFTLSDFEDN
jgi:hypothetical protein